MPLSNAQKKLIAAALDVLATKTLYFDWTTQWVSVHDGNTSQLGGLKPGCRRDSAQVVLGGDIHRQQQKDCTASSYPGVLCGCA